MNTDTLTPQPSSSPSPSQAQPAPHDQAQAVQIPLQDGDGLDVTSAVVEAEAEAEAEAEGATAIATATASEEQTAIAVPAPLETSAQVGQGIDLQEHDAVAIHTGVDTDADADVPTVPDGDIRNIHDEPLSEGYILQHHQGGMGVEHIDGNTIHVNVNADVSVDAGVNANVNEHLHHEHEGQIMHEDQVAVPVAAHDNVDVDVHADGHQMHQEGDIMVNEDVAVQVEIDQNGDVVQMQEHENQQVQQQQHEQGGVQLHQTHQHENVNLTWGHQDPNEIPPGSDQEVGAQVQQVEQIQMEQEEAQVTVQVVDGGTHEHEQEDHRTLANSEIIVANDGTTYEHVYVHDGAAVEDHQSGMVQHNVSDCSGVETGTGVAADANVQYYQDTTVAAASTNPDGDLTVQVDTVAGTPHTHTHSVEQANTVTYEAVQQVEGLQLQQQEHEISQQQQEQQHPHHHHHQEQHQGDQHIMDGVAMTMTDTPLEQMQLPHENTHEQLHNYQHEQHELVSAPGPGPQPVPQTQPEIQQKGTTTAKVSKESQWSEMFRRLEAFKQENNHTMVPKRYANDPKLGTWIETQRVQFRKLWKACGQSDDFLYSMTSDASENHVAFDPTIYVTPNVRLTADRLRRLQAVGFAWTVRKRKLIPMPPLPKNPPNDGNLDMHVNVYGDGENQGLQGKRKSDEMNMTAGSDLPMNVVAMHVEEGVIQSHHDGLGHGHNMLQTSKKLKKKDVQWNDMYERLVEYKSVHGNCLVPKGFSDDPKLACWVETQRHLHSKYYTSNEGGAKDNSDGAVAGSQTQKGGIRLTKERKDKLDEIGFAWSLRSVKMEEHWEEMYAELMQFKERHGDCLVPSRCTENNRLGRWVELMRAEYAKLEKMKESESIPPPESTSKKSHAKTRLTPSRIERLEAAGFEWRIKKQAKVRAKGGTARASGKQRSTPARAPVRKPNNNKQWNEMFECLKQYKEVHGHTKVPKRWKENKQLGCWVDTQRVQYKKRLQILEKGGGTTTKYLRLTDERIQLLESIGFVWSIRDDWQKHFNALVEYRAENGHCNVPARYPLNNRLGIWVVSQRQQYKYLKQIQAGTMAPRSIPITQKRIEMLDELGFSWSLRSNESVAENWQQRYAELCEYRAQYGHCNVPSRYEANRALAAWCGLQRTNHRQYMKAKEQGLDTSTFAMNDERIQKLEEVGFEFSIRTPETIWKKRMEELRAFKLEYGIECAVPWNFKANPRLGIFAQTQRAQRILYEEGRPSTLDEQKIMELNALGFFWNVEEPVENTIHDQGDGIIDAHVIHHPHGEMYHTMVEMVTHGHNHEPVGDSHAHVEHHSTAMMQEGEEIQVEVQETDHVEYSRNLPMLPIAGEEAFQPTYNLVQAGALSMAADIAAAVQENVETIDRDVEHPDEQELIEKQQFTEI